MSRRRKIRSSKAAKSRFRFSLKPAVGWIQAINFSAAGRWAIRSAWVLALAVAIAGWILGVPRLEAVAAQRNAISASDVTIRFVNPPAWINGPLADNLLRTATIQIESNPLGRDDLVAVRQALLSTGWFDSIDQVRRIHPDLIEINAKFVRPYTLIRDGSGHHLIDVNGKLLPKSYGPSDDLPVMLDSRTGLRLPMIVISGAHFKRPAVGRAWEGGDVQSGLRLLHLLDRQPWRHQVAEVDVAAALRDGMIRLRTDRSSVILWGAAPGEEAALELMADGKLERLTLLYENHGRIDGGRTGELDITGEKVAVAR